MEVKAGLGKAEARLGKSERDTDRVMRRSQGKNSKIRKLRNCAHRLGTRPGCISFSWAGSWGFPAESLRFWPPAGLKDLGLVEAPAF